MAEIPTKAERAEWRESVLPSEPGTDVEAVAVRCLDALEEAMEVLKAVEWRGTLCDGRSQLACCPECHAKYGTDHAPDCRLAKMLEGER